jgi:dTDP-4-dehydrorhamnose 3,5-epimerase
MWHWEIPRGFGEPHLSAQDNAIKEIKEEINGEIEKLIDLGEYHSNTGIESFSVRLFLSHISKAADVQVDEGIAYYKFFTVPTFEKMIQTQEITDGFTIAAYTRAKLQGLLVDAPVKNKWIITKDKKIPEILHIKPPIFHDKRGYFMETFDENIYRTNNIPTHFVLNHESRSCKGTLRGLHYQIKYPQGKLVRIAKGKVFTVVVDLRCKSSTFGKWSNIEISSENKMILWVPPGFAHGFLVLSEYAKVVYKTTDIYAPKWERVLAWNDPFLNIKWPIPKGEYPILSEKDSRGILFHNLEYYEDA